MIDSLTAPPACPPVLFVVFNRPETTRQVFQEIRKARPARLYVGADGPREDRPGEAARSAEARRIATDVDWPCQVKTLFRQKNLGCRVAVSEAISWLFENEELGIVLEDDCLPNPTFFPYCAQLLERYRHQDRVMHVAGWSPRAIDDSIPYSYTFSRYLHAWGWATWRRAWKKYRPEPAAWRQAQQQGLLTNMFEGQRKLARLWAQSFDTVYRGKIDTWDYQWVLSCWLNSGVSISPRFNMVRNIGFGSYATHTTAETDDSSTPSATETPFPLVHPTGIDRDPARDRRNVENGLEADQRFRLFRQVRARLTRVFSRALKAAT